MQLLKSIYLCILSLALSLPASAEEHKSHAPKEKEEHHDHKEGEAHHEEKGKGDEHGHGDEHGKGGEKEKDGGHGGHEEGGSAMGPEKGILEAGKLGLRLAPEALKTIDLKSIEFKGSPFTIPYVALLRVKDVKSVYRVRDGWYKSVTAEVLSRNDDSVTVRCAELRPGDQVVVQNIGFLRMAEVISVEGASHSHSH